MTTGDRRTVPALVTFDCYGTLINFDLDGATLAIIGDRLADARIDPSEFLHVFAVMRFHAAMDDYREYKVLIPRCLEHALAYFGQPFQKADGEALIHAIKGFPAFPDVPPALKAVKEQSRIAIISNTDDDLIRHSLPRLGVDFDYVVTAEQAHAYKPSQIIFRYAFGTFGLQPQDITHVAQGFVYDVVPTKRWPMRRIWVNRYGRKGDVAFRPYEEIRDLTALPGLLSH